MPQSAFPYDLLLEIFDYAVIQYSQSLSPLGYKFLRNLALVSKDISLYAQKLIFRSVFLRKRRVVCAFASAINPDTEKGRWLGSQVIKIKAWVGLSHMFTTSLLACPNLRELDLDISSTLPTPSISQTLSACQSDIQFLRLTSDCPCEILCLFPSVKFVEIRSTIGQKSITGSLPTCTLVELHWKGDLTCLRDILAKSVGTLEILSLQNITPISAFHFRSLMATHGRSLRSLHIPSSLVYFFPFLRHCIKLEELIVDSVVTKAALEMLPGTITHLKFQSLAEYLTINENTNFSDFIASIVQLVKTSLSLKTLTWVGHSRSAHDHLLEPCNSHGIVLRVWDEPYGAYEGERQELGYVNQFPRAEPLSQKRLETEPILDVPHRTYIYYDHGPSI